MSEKITDHSKLQVCTLYRDKARERERETIKMVNSRLGSLALINSINSLHAYMFFGSIVLQATTSSLVLLAVAN